MSRLLGIIVCATLTIVAWFMSQLPFAPFTIAHGVHPIEPIIIAMLLGLAFHSLTKAHSKLIPGIRYTSKQVLFFGVILLGSRLNISMILGLSWYIGAILILSILGGALVPLIISSKLNIKRNTRILIAIGTAICGSAAIAACAGAIEASEEEVALSVSVINLLGLLAIFIFPLVAHSLHLPEQTMGLWTGISIQAVPQVVAAGLSYGPQAAMTATFIKLIRVLLLAPAILITRLSTTRTHSHLQSSICWRQYCPPFIIGFFIMMALNSLHFFQRVTLLGYSINLHNLLNTASSLCLAMALCAIGLSTSIQRLLKAGSGPMLLATAGALSITILSLAGLKILTYGLVN